MDLDKIIILQKKINNQLNLYFESNSISKIEVDIQKQLTQGEGFLLFNCFLLSNKKIKEHFLNLFVETAITGSENLIGISREILLTIGNSSNTRDRLFTLIHKILKQNESDNSSKYFYFRNTAQLLYDMNLTAELNQFLTEYCKDSTDIDIQEIYDDFLD